MEYVCTAEEMKRYDLFTSEKIGIHAFTLMERAALETAKVILNKNIFPDIKSILVLCGPGNNGGDGLALARILSEVGLTVHVFFIKKYEKVSELFKKQSEILQKYDVEFVDKLMDSYDLYVDAIFGTGLKRDLTSEFADAVNMLNKTGKPVLSMDIPSGIDSDDGSVKGVCVKSNITVTYSFYKRGIFMYPGSKYCGKVIKVNVGISDKAFGASKPEMFISENEFDPLPKRLPDGNKSTFGKVLLIAGSKNMAGAALLCARAAMKTGAGMVKILSPEDNRIIIQETLPEALYGTFDDLEISVKWCDLIVIGPGLSKSDEAKTILLKTLAFDTDKPIVIDADAINLIAKDEILKKTASDIQNRLIFTPHVGEASRLLNRDVSHIKKYPVESIKELQKKYGAVFVLKDARTFVKGYGDEIFMNIWGNDKMATAGSGDVLSGIIGAFIGFKEFSLFECAVRGVHLHAKSGDRAVEKIRTGIVASDIIENI
ncbi:MAG: NAD(P)H-hydrate dehydratase [Acetatifactor sp.]|nr:NAD(P)H-hydrate dehydratase [Acetatifactor sp.]